MNNAFLRTCGTALATALLVIALPLAAVEVNAPDAERWNPVQHLLDGNDDQAALPLLGGIVTDFPRWPHGWLKRAEVHERLGNLPAALEDAQRALALDRESDANASTVARLLVRLSRYDEAIAIQEAFLPRSERQGWVSYYAAEAAFNLGDSERAKSLLTRAINQAGRNVPPELRFLDGRILEQAGDLAGAAAAFRRGLSDAPDHASHWFNLGAVYRQLAAGGDANALDSAIECFGQAVRMAADDPHAWFALGQSYLDRGDYVSAESNLRSALSRFANDNISQGHELAITHASYGLTMLRLAEQGNPAGSHSEALSQLRRAEQLGISDAPLYNNMLAAAIGAQANAGSAGEQQQYARAAEEIINGPGASHISPINLGMSYFHSARLQFAQTPDIAFREAELAIEMFNRGIDSAGDMLPSLYRYLGHAHLLAADSANILAAASDEAVLSRGWAEHEEHHRNDGRDAYAQAANLRDGFAQRHYLARESERSAHHAYAAAWRYLGWRSYLDPAGWKVVIANYGMAEAYRSPISMGVWGVFLALCLILGCKAFFLPKPLPKPAERRPTNKGAERREAPRPGTGATQRKPEAPRPGTGATQRKPPAVVRDNRTTQDAPAPTRRAVDDIARRMAARQGNAPQPPEQRPAPPRRPRR